jgi:hypothetical protein
MDVIDGPALPLDHWLLVVTREYLDAFLPAGGGAVKFVIAEEDTIETLLRDITGLATQRGMATSHLGAGTTRLHMLQDVFFALARTLPWDDLARRYTEDLFTRNDYPWPRPGQHQTMPELAQEFGVSVNLLARSRDQWLSRDFRSAMLHLCLSHLDTDADDADAGSTVLAWLAGEKVPLSLLRQCEIAARITRTNARAMLISTCHWLRKCGVAGLLLTLDLRPALLVGTAAVEQTVRYSPTSVMDLYEVLREIIDDVERLPGLFALVLADQALVAGDRKRTLDSYKALEMRIWPDVHPGDRQNPLAPLVTLGA